MPELKPSFRGLRRVGAACLLAVLAACASAPSAEDPRVARLGALFEQAVPIGEVMALASRRNPNWPFNDARTAVSASQLACVRAELVPEKVGVVQRLDARNYAMSHAANLDRDIAVLESGAALAFNRFVLEGAQASLRGAEPDVQGAVSTLTPGQARALMSVMLAPEYRELRSAMRLSGIADATTARDAQASARAGSNLGASLALNAILSAMETCQVPLSTLAAQP